MANMNRPAYQGKQLSPTPDRQQSQGRATAQRTGSVDRSLLPQNEPQMPSRPISPRHPRDLDNPNRGGVAR